MQAVLIIFALECNTNPLYKLPTFRYNTSHTTRKRTDEESTCTEAFQRTSPQVTAAERDEAGGMWKMASEQRTEPGTSGLGCDRFRLL